MFKPAHFLLLASFSAVAASAQAPTGVPFFSSVSGRQCFRVATLAGYTPGPPGMVAIRADRGRWFQMHLSRGCPDFSLIMQIGLRPTESTWLCEGDAAELAGLPLDRNVCFVGDIRRLAPGEAPAAV
jgi:hypothetical protein